MDQQQCLFVLLTSALFGRHNLSGCLRSGTKHAGKWMTATPLRHCAAVTITPFYVSWGKQHSRVCDLRQAAD